LKPAYIIETNEGPVAFASIPKCGQHTLNAISVGMVLPQKLARFKRWAFIREPFDRLESAFHFYSEKGYKINGGKVGSWENFVDWALLSDDEHVLPQYLFVKAFDKYIKMDFMDSVLGTISDYKPMKLNVSQRHHKTDLSYREKDIKHRYNNDFKLYESAFNGLC